MRHDQDLALAALALQLGLVDSDEVVAAVSVWARDKRRRILDLLVEGGATTPQAAQLLQALADCPTAQPPPSAAELLARAPRGEAVVQSLRTLGDDELSASLSPADAVSESHTLATFTTQGGVDEPSPHDAATRLEELDEPGRQRFHVLHLHAEGGLGEVWMAEDAQLRRRVALKEIRSAAHADELPSRARFVQEAEITGRLEHPGIVPVYALGKHNDGRPFYVMRFIRGQSLQSAIDRCHQARGSQPNADADAPTLRQLLGRFIDMCEAVAYAHSRGVLHRDLKPDNVMLGSFGETLVVDWGLAKADGVAPPPDDQNRAESLVHVDSGTPTMRGSAIGTPGYMSPEQADGATEELTAATDIYSLGATLFCLLTGRPPIVGRDVQQVLEDTRSGRVPLARDLVADVPRPLQSVCLRALALDPAARYETALELAGDAQCFLDDEPVAAHRDSWIEQASRWVRRHRSGVVAGATALLLVAVIATVAALLIAQSRDRALDLANRNRQLAIAEREAREQAQLRQQQAEQASKRAQQQQSRAETFYQLSISTVDKYLTGVAEDDRLKAVGLENLRRDLLIQARDFYDLMLARATEDEDPHNRQRAEAQHRLGDIHMEVGEYTAAVAAYKQAATHYLADGMSYSDSSTYASLINDLAMAHDGAGQVDEAIKLWRQLIDAVQEIVEQDPDDELNRYVLTMAQLNLALRLHGEKPAESIALSAAAQQNAKKTLELAPDDPDYANSLALIHNNLANTLIFLERYPEAGVELLAAEKIWTQLRESTAGHQADALDDSLALLHLNQAVVAANSDDNDKASALLQQALNLRIRIAEQHPDADQLQNRRAFLHQTAAVHYSSMVRYQDALQQFDLAEKIYQRLHDAHPTVPEYRLGLAEGRLERAETLYAMGAMDEAVDSARRAMEDAAWLVERHPDEDKYIATRAAVQYYLGAFYIEAADLRRAEQALKAAASQLQGLLRKRADDTGALSQLVDCQSTLAMIYGLDQLDRPQQAQQWWDRTRESADLLLSTPLRERLAPSTILAVRVHRANALTGLEQYPQALAEWDAIVADGGDTSEYEIGIGRASALFWAGRLDDALKQAMQTAAQQQHPSIVFAIARDIALSVPVLEELNLSKPELDRWTEQLGAAAVQLLQQAADLEFFDSPESLKLLEQDAFLTPIRNRDDFQELKKNLESP